MKKSLSIFLMLILIGVCMSLWDTVQKVKVWTAYIRNVTKSGDYYWFFAIVYICISCDGSIVIFLVEENLQEK